MHNIAQHSIEADTSKNMMRKQKLKQEKQQQRL